MSSPNGEGYPSYKVHNSQAISNEFKKLQRRATRQGRGEEFLQAAHEAYERMSQGPLNFGEPLYRLPAMRLQIRCAVVPPLVFHFAVSEVRPIVYIQAVKVLS